MFLELIVFIHVNVSRYYQGGEFQVLMYNIKLFVYSYYQINQRPLETINLFHHRSVNINCCCSQQFNGHIENYYWGMREEEKDVVIKQILTTCLTGCSWNCQVITCNCHFYNFLYMSEITRILAICIVIEINFLFMEIYKFDKLYFFLFIFFN